MSSAEQISLFDYGKSLDDLDGNMIAQLQLLISLEPEKQIAALSAARKEVRQSIMKTIGPPSRREIYRNIAAFRVSASVPLLPQELWNIISSYMSSFSTRNAADVFLPVEFTKDQGIHERIWRSIFRDEKWLDLAFEEYNTNPVLLGPDLLSFTNRDRKNTDINIILLAGDWSGELFFHDEEEKFTTFGNSLQEHTYNKEMRTIFFNSGINLNISQVITGCEEIELLDLWDLFEIENGKLQTVYCPWVYPKGEQPVSTVGEGDIIAKEGIATGLSDINNICGIRLSYLKQQEAQQIFTSPHSPTLEPIYKDGEGYPRGEIQGWSVW